MDQFVNQLTAWLEFNHVSSATLIGTAALLVGCLIVFPLLNRFLRRSVRRAEMRLHLPYETLARGTRILTAGLWLIAILLLFELWGVNFGGLWTLLASTAAVIGVGFLAVWTIVSNVTASLFISIWRPFRLGQTVEIVPEALKGRVVDRNMMFTALREEGGGVLQIPNNFFFQKMFRVTDNSPQSLFELLENEDRAQAKKMQAAR
jgi:small-conductance mechanosensitive channel